MICLLYREFHALKSLETRINFDLSSQSPEIFDKIILDRIYVVLFRVVRFSKTSFRACLHGGGGPQVGEVTHLSGATRLVHTISYFIFITFT